MSTPAAFESRWEKFLDHCGRELSPEHLADVRKAFDLQAQLLQTAVQEEAPALAKPSYKVACILVNEVNLRRDAVVASILSFLMDIDAEQVKKHELYAGKVKQLVDDTIKIRSLKVHMKQEGQDPETAKAKRKDEEKKRETKLANLLKLVLTVSTDIRAVLIELAWKLHAARRFDTLLLKEREALLFHIKHFYAPIAHRLGLYAIKTELEDLWLKNSDPDMYRDIARQLDETKRDRERFIEGFIAPIRTALDAEGIDCEIKGRPKSIYSIWNKMNKQGVGFEKVYDKFAIRIILNTKELADEKPACWHAYSLVTEHYKPFPKRLRDWISAPKSSGYESLHTTVETESGKWVEVQIRTRRMDDIAEKGQAAHWKYKEKEGADSLDSLLRDMRSALEKPEDERDNEQTLVKDALYEKDIFVFTPKGELHQLRAGSSVLDLAFKLHTELGAHSKGAKVNDKFVTNRHVLKNADTVDVVKASTVQVSPAWLNHVVSPRAKAKIKRYLREQQYSWADLGKEMLDFKIKQWKVDKPDEAQHRLMKLLEMTSLMELFDAIGQDKVDLLKYKNELIGARREEAALRKGKQLTNGKVKIEHGREQLVLGQGGVSVEFSYATCCRPIPGDEVFGFVTVRDNIKIHKTSCPNAFDLLTRYPYRVISARWADNLGNFRFLTTLNCDTAGRTGLINDITRLVLDSPNVLLKALETRGKGNQQVISVTLEADQRQSIDHLRNRILALEGVRDVYRPD